MSDINISDRAKRILEAVVRGYVETGAPVGSRTVVRQYGIDLSPATVRNEMADLEQLGLLGQTHVSSGRRPTEQGIRYYLDNIVRIEELSPDRQALVRSMYPRDGEDYRGVVRASSRVLASLTRFTGVVWSPGIQALPLKHIEFIRLAPSRIMAVLVSPGGWFHTSVFDWSEEITLKELERASGFLNEKFEGKTLPEVRGEIISQMREMKAEYDRMLARAFRLMDSALRPEWAEEELFIDGKSNLVDNPEFADVDKMKGIFKAFEEKGFIVKLLGKAMVGGKFKVLLSSEENPAGMPGLAVIMAAYGDSKDLKGTLGVIGPVRMDYPSVIPLVTYTARYVSSLLTS